MQATRRGIISLDALIQCFNLNRGELEQLEAWIFHYPDLLQEVKPGYYATEPAIQAVKNVLSTRETLENPGELRENVPVIAGRDWVDGRQAARLL